MIWFPLQTPGDLGYRMAKDLAELYKDNNDIRLRNIQWRTQHSLTNFEDIFIACLSYF